MLDWSTHSAYSDPGMHRHLLTRLPGSAARNVIGHYAVELADADPDLPCVHPQPPMRPWPV